MNISLYKNDDWSHTLILEMISLMNKMKVETLQQRCWCWYEFVGSCIEWPKRLVAQRILTSEWWWSMRRRRWWRQWLAIMAIAMNWGEGGGQIEGKTTIHDGRMGMARHHFEENERNRFDKMKMAWRRARPIYGQWPSSFLLYHFSRTSGEYSRSAIAHTH